MLVHLLSQTLFLGHIKTDKTAFYFFVYFFFLTESVQKLVNIISIPPRKIVIAIPAGITVSQSVVSIYIPSSFSQGILVIIPNILLTTM